MFKFEINGKVYSANTIEALQETLKVAGLNIDIQTLLDEQQEVLNEVLNQEQEIVNEYNKETDDLINEEYAKVLSDKKVDNKLN